MIIKDKKFNFSLHIKTDSKTENVDQVFFLHNLKGGNPTITGKETVGMECANRRWRKLPNGLGTEKKQRKGSGRCILLYYELP